MSESVSDQLLRIIRKTITEKNLNTAAFAAQCGMSRRDVKKILSGKTPLLVEDFVNFATLLELEKTLPGLQIEQLEEQKDEDEQDGSAIALTELKQVITAYDYTPDPMGNHAQQMLKFGFAMGVDILLMLKSDLIHDSNVPEHVLKQFPNKLPVKLDALYQDKMKLRYHEFGFEILLSFDGLYECFILWGAVEHVVFFPLSEDLPDDDSDSEADDSTPHLRLV